MGYRVGIEAFLVDFQIIVRMIPTTVKSVTTITAFFDKKHMVAVKLSEFLIAL